LVVEKGEAEASTSSSGCPAVPRRALFVFLAFAPAVTLVADFVLCENRTSRKIRCRGYEPEHRNEAKSSRLGLPPRILCLVMRRGRELTFTMSSAWVGFGRCRRGVQIRQSRTKCSRHDCSTLRVVRAHSHLWLLHPNKGHQGARGERLAVLDAMNLFI
jgi:hypothetical protein